MQISERYENLPYLRRVRGGIYKRGARSVQVVRLTATDERDKGELMLISAKMRVPMCRECDKNGIVTAFYLEFYPVESNEKFCVEE